MSGSKSRKGLCTTVLKLLQRMAKSKDLSVDTLILKFANTLILAHTLDPPFLASCLHHIYPFIHFARLFLCSMTTVHLTSTESYPFSWVVLHELHMYYRVYSSLQGLCHSFLPPF